MVKTCYCGNTFVTYPSKILLRRGKYCSKKCSNKITLFNKDIIPWNKGLKLPQFSGKNHPKYKGWRYCGRNHKYRMLLMPNHSMADIRGYIREHRYIMSLKLGRLLTKDEEIHHLDGNGLNNNPENLIIVNKIEHLRLEHKNGTYQKHLNKLHGSNRRENQIYKTKSSSA